MGDMMSYFKIVLIVQLFFSFSITSIIYAMPANDLNYVTSFSDVANSIDFNSTVNKVQSSVTQQQNLPLIEFGALLFYSGNIIIDLLLNFVYATPQMISLLFTGIFNLFNIDPFVMGYVQVFLMTLMTLMYLIGIIQLATNIRSRGSGMT